MASTKLVRSEPDWKALPRLRVIVAGVTIDPPGATYGPRVQNHYEFIWLTQGEAKVSFGRKTFAVEEGTILLRKPGVKDYFEWSPKRSTIHAYIHFDLDPRRREMVSASSAPAFRKMPGNDILRPLFGYLLQLDELPEPLRSEMMGSALDLLLRGYVSGQVTVKSQPQPRLPEAVGRAVDLIRTNTAQSPPAPLKLRELSQAAHTTPENLCRMFKKFLGLGPLKYAKLARLDRAAHQLLRTATSLKEIALSTGFYDEYHFSRSFKQVYGMSPKEFRVAVYNEWLTQKNPIIRSFYGHNELPEPGKLV